MDFKGILQILINETEKVFRFIIPGFLFLVQLKYAFPQLFEILCSKLNSLILLFIALIVGSCIYVMHRIVLEVIDNWLFYKKDYKTPLSSFFLRSRDM